MSKQLALKVVRGVAADQIRGAFRDSLWNLGQDAAQVFSGLLSRHEGGSEYALRWTPGGVLETTVNGMAKPPIADKAFPTAVFALWLGDKPIQDDIKKDLIPRTPQITK